MIVRANPQRGTREVLLEELQGRFPEAAACPVAPLGIRLGHPGAPALDPAFVEGRFTVQDEASQLVVEWLAPQPGERVLDLCAAPGTKTTAIAERVGPSGRVVAVDRSGRRLALVGRACRRHGLSNVTLVEADATQPLPDDAAGPYDRVLVDAPCSGLGTLRRNPDARWRVTPDAPASLARTQEALARAGAAVLRPGGVLVYSTCTLLREENEAVVAALLAGEPELEPCGLPDAAPTAQADAERPEWLRPLLGSDGCLRTWPHRHDMDGFFAARIRRGSGASHVETR